MGDKDQEFITLMLRKKFRFRAGLPSFSFRTTRDTGFNNICFYFRSTTVDTDEENFMLPVSQY